MLTRKFMHFEIIGDLIINFKIKHINYKITIYNAKYYSV